MAQTYRWSLPRRRLQESVRLYDLAETQELSEYVLTRLHLYDKEDARRRKGECCVAVTSEL
jgi:hypothetical protein